MDVITTNHHGYSIPLVGVKEQKTVCKYKTYLKMSGKEQNEISYIYMVIIGGVVVLEIKICNLHMSESSASRQISDFIVWILLPVNFQSREE